MELTDFRFENLCFGAESSEISLEDLEENPKFIATIARNADAYEKEIIEKHNNEILRKLNESIKGNTKSVRNAKKMVEILLENTEVTFTETKILLLKDGQYIDCETGDVLDEAAVLNKEPFEKYFKKSDYVKFSDSGKAIMVIINNEPIERFKKNQEIC